MIRTAQLRFSGIVWHEVPIEKSIDNFAILEDLMNVNLNIQHYTQEVDYILFVFLIHLPHQKIHTEHYHFHKRKRFIDIQLQLDYFEIMSATPDEVRQMMAKLFIDSIPLYSKMKLAQFDDKRFYEDVKSLFEKANLTGARRNAEPMMDSSVYISALNSGKEGF
jgi:hypothetical protein